MASKGRLHVVGAHRSALRAFVLQTVLDGNDTPMRRHELAMDLANGLGLLMISQFTAERRDVVRSLTLSHFKNNTPLLLDIVLDSASESVFAARLLEWVPSVLSAWIYKLSLQYSSRMAGVKKLFVQCLVNSVKKVQPANRKSIVLMFV